MNEREALLSQLLKDLDSRTTGAIRFLAGRTSRRSFLGRFGVFIAGMGALPVLPVLREAVAQQASNPVMGVADIEEMGDPLNCEYWRYCGLSGSLCGCCGGSMTQCPPGSQTASVAWVGSCHNPTDGRDYLISYNDCCGKSSCGGCGCSRAEGDKPVYFPSKSNSILWCFGSTSHAYHCTLALVIGHADSNGLR
jgi:methylamine dehydrogenase light chain